MRVALWVWKKVVSTVPYLVVVMVASKAVKMADEMDELLVGLKVVTMDSSGTMMVVVWVELKAEVGDVSLAAVMAASLVGQKA